MDGSSTDTRSPAGSEPVRLLGPWLLVFGASALVCLAVYRGALHGQFISDDRMFIGNPYVMSPGPDLLSEVFVPGGYVQTYAGGNYAPIPVLAHVLEFRLFGQHSFGFHVVNVLVHAVNVTLLVATFRLTGIPPVAALSAGALFAVHPANVEAVAWVSQLRALLAMAFALIAILSFRRHPLIATFPFVLGLLSKSSASFALPMCAALCWVWRPSGEVGRAHAVALGSWLLAVPLFAYAQLQGFVAPLVEPYPDLLTLLRTVLAIGARYLAMAATGFGTSAFHELPAVSSNTDPWWLAGLALVPLFLWRLAVTLRRRSPEAAWWLGAAAAYVPVSQIIPFLYGMADRWLYFVLPALLAGTILAGQDLLARPADASGPASPGGRSAATLRRAALAGVTLLATAFAVQAWNRANLWVLADDLQWDAASQYPEGVVAHRMKAYRAVHEGDVDLALHHLRACAAHNGDLMEPFYHDPRLAPLGDDPRFQALVRENATRSLEYRRSAGIRDQLDLLSVAVAHYQLDEIDDAIEALEEGLRRGGPAQRDLSTFLFDYTAERARRRHEAGDR